MAAAIAKEAARKRCSMVAFGVSSTQRNEPVGFIIVNIDSNDNSNKSNSKSSS